MTLKALLAVIVLVALLISLLISLIFEPAIKIKRMKRIEALRQGAPETYFEELRALETYPSEVSIQWPYEVFRLLLIALCMTTLVKF